MAFSLGEGRDEAAWAVSRWLPYRGQPIPPKRWEKVGNGVREGAARAVLGWPSLLECNISDANVLHNRT